MISRNQNQYQKWAYFVRISRFKHPKWIRHCYKSEKMHNNMPRSMGTPKYKKHPKLFCGNVPVRPSYASKGKTKCKHQPAGKLTFWPSFWLCEPRIFHQLKCKRHVMHLKHVKHMWTMRDMLIITLICLLRFFKLVSDSWLKNSQII